MTASRIPSPPSKRWASGSHHPACSDVPRSNRASSSLGNALLSARPRSISSGSTTSSMVLSPCAPTPCSPGTALAEAKSSGSNSIPKRPSPSGPSTVTPARSASRPRMPSSLAYSPPNPVLGGPRIRLPCSALAASRRRSACSLLKSSPGFTPPRRTRTSLLLPLK